MAKKLSPAMFAWAKANKSKLKSPTAAQKKIFAQYDAMVKAGDTPANPKPRPAKPSKPKKSAKLTIPGASKKSKAEVLKDADNYTKARERFFSSSSKGKYGNSKRAALPDNILWE